MTPRMKFQNPVVLVEVKINARDCPICGVVYGLASDYEERRRADGKSWKCPNDHWVRFTKSAAAQERAAREKAEQELVLTRNRLASEQGWASSLSEDLSAERKSHAATKGQLTKTRKRIDNGVCPDCHRHFVNVERHMKTKHSVPEAPR